MADPQLVTLEEDGPLGPAGTQVWVNDPADVQKAEKASSPRKAAAPKKTDTK